jgi:hypothetical protein
VELRKAYQWPSDEESISSPLECPHEILKNSKEWLTDELRRKCARICIEFRPLERFADYEFDAMGRELRLKGKALELESKS